MVNIVMLGTGFIGRFYADSIQGYRNQDKIIGAYSRREEAAQQFAKDYNCQFYTTDLDEAINNPAVDLVCVALPNHLHLKAIELCCKYKKGVIMTKPLARNATEAYKILKLVEESGIFNGYLEDLVYTPKFIKAKQSVDNGAIGRVLWARSREAHPGPHSDWFWNKELAGGGCMLDLGCHCIEIARSFIGKNIKPIEVMCWAATQVKPIDAEDHAIGLVKYDNGAIGQFEVSWTFRGGLDLRDEVMGSEGTIWTNSFLRTGFEMFTTGNTNSYVAEKAEINKGWLFPVGDELNELGYNHMFMDMFNAFENKTTPKETFYDGYVVNAILEAAYKSAETKIWEPVILEDWRGIQKFEKKTETTKYEIDPNYCIIKEELTHYGTKKLILKHLTTNEIIEKIITD